MLKQKLLYISLLTILLVAVFHYTAIKYNWYWTFRWLDIPVHVVAGFWVSVTALWISLKIKHIDSIIGYKKKALLVMLISVFLIAFFWETFELIFRITSLQSKGYVQDSLSDIFNGFLGGLIAFLYFSKNNKAKCSINLLTKIATSNNLVL